MCVFAGIKLNQGTYISKTHIHFKEVLQHATWVHLAHSEGFKSILIALIGCVWDCWIAAGEVRALWAGGRGRRGGGGLPRG